MLKIVGKTTIALAAMSIATLAFAGGPDHMAMPSHESNAHGNFFLGVAGGMGMFDGAYSAIRSTQHFFAPNAGGDSFLGGLLVGYQTVFTNQVYLGLVGNVLYNSLNSVIWRIGQDPGNLDFNKAVVKNNFQGGLALRLGRRMSSGVTPYVLGGAEVGDWRLSVANGNAFPVSGIPANTTAAVSKTLIGPQVGAGVLFDLNHRWQAGLEYAHTWFGDVNFVATTGSTANHKLIADQNQVLASAMYQFNA